MSILYWEARISASDMHTPEPPLPSPPLPSIAAVATVAAKALPGHALTVIGAKRDRMAYTHCCPGICHSTILSFSAWTTCGGGGHVQTADRRHARARVRLHV